MRLSSPSIATYLRQVRTAGTEARHRTSAHARVALATALGSAAGLGLTSALVGALSYVAPGAVGAQTFLGLLSVVGMVTVNAAWYVAARTNRAAAAAVLGSSALVDLEEQERDRYAMELDDIRALPLEDKRKHSLYLEAFREHQKALRDLRAEAARVRLGTGPDFGRRKAPLLPLERAGEE